MDFISLSVLSVGVLPFGKQFEESLFPFAVDSPVDGDTLKPLFERFTLLSEIEISPGGIRLGGLYKVVALFFEIEMVVFVIQDRFGGIGRRLSHGVDVECYLVGILYTVAVE